MVLSQALVEKIVEIEMYDKEYDECPRCGKKGVCYYLCADCREELSSSKEENDMKKINTAGLKATGQYLFPVKNKESNKNGFFYLKKMFYRSGCTIIIPTWNCIDTLAKCLLSILSAFPDKVPLEVIFIDKGSDDGTLSCIEYYMKEGRLDQIPYKVVMEPGKLGKARLYGIEHAKYKTLFWLDSDIVLPKNYIVNLFKQAEKLLKQGLIPSLEDIFGLQGWMNCGSDKYPRQELWHKWWHGYDILQFKKRGFCDGSPTADLLNLNAYRLTFEEKQELSGLSSQEDNYLSTKARDMGYKLYAVDISVPHLKFAQKRARDSIDHEILWLLVGEKDQGRTKLEALWHFKWTIMRGLETFYIYKDFKLLTLTFKIWVNTMRVMLKDEKIISGERLVSLRDW